MTTPLDVYRHAWVDYWAHHLGPSYDQPPGNSYECDEFVARRVFEAGQRSSVTGTEPDREALGRTVYEGVFPDEPPWAQVGGMTRRVCCDVGERLYAMGRASRNAEVEALEQQLALAPKTKQEDRRCGTCKFAKQSWSMFPCCRCGYSGGYSHWQKR